MSLAPMPGMLSMPFMLSIVPGFAPGLWDGIGIFMSIFWGEVPGDAAGDAPGIGMFMSIFCGDAAGDAAGDIPGMGIFISIRGDAPGLADGEEDETGICIPGMFMSIRPGEA